MKNLGKYISWLCGTALGVFILIGLRGFWYTRTVTVAFEHSNTTRFNLKVVPLDNKGYDLLRGGVGLTVPETDADAWESCEVSVPIGKLPFFRIDFSECSGKFRIREFRAVGKGCVMGDRMKLSPIGGLELTDENGVWTCRCPDAGAGGIIIMLPKKLKGARGVIWFAFGNVLLLSILAGVLAGRRMLPLVPEKPGMLFFVELLFIGGIFAAIALPPTGMDSDTVSKGENRKLAPPPELFRNRRTNLAFFREFDQWYNDRFMGRSQGIDLYQTLFRPTGYAFQGRNGWFFSNVYGAVEAACNQKQYSDAELGEMAARLENLRDYLAGRGCRFYLVLVPSKGRVYFDNFPTSYPRLHPVSRYEQVVSYLREHTDLTVIDPLPEMMRLRADGECGDLYYRYGTHWTPEGAYTAYRLLRREIVKDFPAGGEAVPEDQLVNTPPVPAETELLMQLNIDADQFCAPEELSVPAWRPPVDHLKLVRNREILIYNFTTTGYEPASPEAAEAVAAMPRGYFYGDSFMGGLSVCELNHYSRVELATIGHANSFRLSLGAPEFEALKPQIYILLTNELALDRLLRIDLPEE